MAGGKETPRQKMIGMMYLVLTALLALQVSNAVLEKFAIIESTLTELVKDQKDQNAQTFASIIEEAGKSQRPNVLQAKENAQKVRELTQQTVSYIDKLKAKMMETSGHKAVDEGLINDHSSKVASMMVTQSDGKEFEKMLNDYVSKLRAYTGLTAKEFPTLAKAPKEHEVFKNDKDHANKDFLTFTFENTPVIAALASVSQMQTEVLEYETKALDHLRELAGAQKKTFDNIVPMVRARESIVAAGATYEADLFVSASSSSFSPDMFQDGKKLNVVDDPETGVKMGKIKFTASGGGYDPKTGLAKKTFKADIKLQDTTYTRNIEYFVAQPVIRVTTGNAPTLYMNCGNTVNIEVPALGTNYNPSFSAAGADIIKGDKPGRVTIIPNQRKINVNVSNAGAGLGSVAFDVKPIPLPRYVIKDNTGKEVDKKNGVRGGALTGLRVVPEPEPNFKEEVPKDAVYRIRSMEVIHARGTSPVNRITVTNENIDLAAWRAQFKPGDRIVIEVKTVTRKTYKNEDEKVEVKNEVYQVPIQ